MAGMADLRRAYGKTLLEAEIAMLDECKPAMHLKGKKMKKVFVTVAILLSFGLLTISETAVANTTKSKAENAGNSAKNTLKNAGEGAKDTLHETGKDAKDTMEGAGRVPYRGLRKFFTGK